MNERDCIAELTANATLQPADSSIYSPVQLLKRNTKKRNFILVFRFWKPSRSRAEVFTLLWWCHFGPRTANNDHNPAFSCPNDSLPASVRIMRDDE